eukprot:Colp12_sorted_trinity150504_noHs@34345
MSVACPLIAPFGWLFFSLRYLVDKHNIVYVKPIEYESDGRTARFALQCVIAVTLVAQLGMLGFFVYKTRIDHPFSVILMITSLLTACFFVYILLLRPIFRTDLDDDDTGETSSAEEKNPHDLYVPPILRITLSTPLAASTSHDSSTNLARSLSLNIL